MVGASKLAFLFFCTAAGAGGHGDLELRDAVAELREQLESQRLIIAAQRRDLDELRDSSMQRARHSSREEANELDVEAVRWPQWQDHRLRPSAHRRLHEARVIEDLATAMDHMWLILCGSIVMFMQAGFAMIEAGACRAKSIESILMKKLADVCFGTFGWWSLGYALAYGGPLDANGFLGNGFAGSRHFFGVEFNADVREAEAAIGGDPMAVIQPSILMLEWFFQWALCSTVVTIVSGGFAERVRFGGHAVYATAIAAVIYPVVVAWTWGSGWLSKEVNDVNFVDFAGSGIVHMTGGVGALVGAIIAGPRHGRWSKEHEQEFVPHSVPLVVLGTFILWFGWYGLNCGATLGMHDGPTGMLAAQVAMNTTISGAAGGIAAVILRLAIVPRFDVSVLCNGVLAGLVGISAGCGNVESGSAFCIGIVAGLLCVAISLAMKKLHVDDPLDMFAVHGANGAWGVLAAGLFDWGKAFDHVHGESGWSCMQNSDGSGCLEGAGGQLFAANLVEVASLSAWVALTSVIVFLPLQKVGLLRAPGAQQDRDLDTACLRTAGMDDSPPKAFAVDSDSPPV